MSSLKCFHNVPKSFNYQGMRVDLPYLVLKQTDLKALTNDG